MATYIPSPGAPSHTATDPISLDQFVSTVRLLVSQHYCCRQDEFTLSFSGITPAYIEALDEAAGYTDNKAREPADEPSLRKCHITYSGTSGFLTIKMPSTKQQRLAGGIGGHLIRQMYRMGLQDTVETLGPVRITSVTQEGACIEGDMTFLPRPQRQTSQSPSLAIEIGITQSLPDLHAAKDRWFDMTPPGGGVNVVLLAKQFATHLRVECWTRGNPEPSIAEVRQGSGPSGESDWAWIVTGPVVIPFEPVMIRLKEAGEDDFVLNEDVLVELAERVWM